MFLFWINYIFCIIWYAMAWWSLPINVRVMLLPCTRNIIINNISYYNTYCVLPTHKLLYIFTYLYLNRKNASVSIICCCDLWPPLELQQQWQSRANRYGLMQFLVCRVSTITIQIYTILADPVHFVALKTLLLFKSF